MYFSRSLGIEPDECGPALRRRPEARQPALRPPRQEIRNYPEEQGKDLVDGGFYYMRSIYINLTKPRL